MIRKLTWKRILIFIARAFAALAVAGFGYTLWHWFQNPSESHWEPLNVLANSAFSLFNGLASLIALWGSSRVPDTPIKLWQAPPRNLGEENWLRNRHNLLQNVKNTWIDGFLKNSLHSAIELELGLEYKPDAVSRTWGIVLQRSEQSDQSIPEDKTIYEVFEENGRSLLILGEPGSGKTITLLQLAEDLISKAEAEETHPIPVVFNLSSWANQRRALLDWLVDEAFIQYQASKALSRSWIEQNHLLLLLDGLDEVAESYRDDCIRTINNFKAQYPAEIVVCSRVADYERLSNRLNLPNAVLIQPLTPSQIDTYLVKFGSSLDGVRAALTYDEDLQKLSQSPLLLSIMTIAYGDFRPDELTVSASFADNRRFLFATYVERMFNRRPLPADAAYSQPQTVHWLANLAYGMLKHSQSIFYIERLQPTWLFEDSFYCYEWLLRLLGGLYFGLLFGLLWGLSGESLLGLSGALIGALAGGLAHGLAYLLFPQVSRSKVKLIEELSTLRSDLSSLIKETKARLLLTLEIGFSVDPIETVERLSFSRSHVGYLMRKAGIRLFFGLGRVLLFGLFSGLFGGLVLGWVGLSYVLLALVSAGLLYGEVLEQHTAILFGGLLLGLYSEAFGPGFSTDPIETVERLSFSRSHVGYLIRKIEPSVLALLLGEMLIMSLFGAMLAGVTDMPFGTLLIFLLIWLLTILPLEWSTMLNTPLQDNKSQHLLPNQGIRSSRRNALAAGVLLGLLFGLLGWLTGKLSGELLLSLQVTLSNEYRLLLAFLLIPMLLFDLTYGLLRALVFILILALFGEPIFGLVFGFIFGLFSGHMRYGGEAVIQHYTLRYLLSYDEILPFPFRSHALTAFLDDMADRIILRRIGGGWIFVHRYLLEYFASLSRDLRPE